MPTTRIELNCAILRAPLNLSSTWTRQRTRYQRSEVRRQRAEDRRQKTEGNL